MSLLRRDFIKTLLARVGSTLSERTVHNLNGAINYAETGRWLASGGFRPRIRVKHDRELSRSDHQSTWPRASSVSRVRSV